MKNCGCGFVENARIKIHLGFTGGTGRIQGILLMMSLPEGYVIFDRILKYIRRIPKQENRLTLTSLFIATVRKKKIPHYESNFPRT